jgi:hypothetical protein
LFFNLISGNNFPGILETLSLFKVIQGIKLYIRGDRENEWSGGGRKGGKGRNAVADNHQAIRMDGGGGICMY